MVLNEAFELYLELVLRSSSARAQKTEIGRWKSTFNLFWDSSH